jgi:hypothetical protein
MPVQAGAGHAVVSFRHCSADGTVRPRVVMSDAKKYFKNFPLGI